MIETQEGVKRVNWVRTIPRQPAVKGWAGVSTHGSRVSATQQAALVIVAFALTVTSAPLIRADATTKAAQAVVDLPDVAPPSVGDPTSETELRDLGTLAAQRDISLEEAIDRYAWNDNFALAVNVVRELFPNAFSGAEIVDSQQAWIAFTGDVPDGALEVFASFRQSHPGVAVEIHRDFGFTELGLQEVIETVHYAVLAATGVRDASTSFDYGTRRITIVVSLDGEGATVDSIRATAIARVADAGLENVLNGITVDVLISGLPALGGPTTSNAHLGGERLDDCTSGFTVKNGSGVRGTSTAGHCADPQHDDGVSLAFKADHEGTHGDLQWNSGSQGEPDDFYAGSPTALEVDRRDLSAVGAPVVGEPLCKNGKTTFKTCLEVIQLNVCHGSLCNLVQMDQRTTVSGDSGGPWYWGTTAYGLMYGWRYDPVWPFDRDLFSRADRLDNALGVTVPTN